MGTGRYTLPKWSLGNRQFKRPQLHKGFQTTHRKSQILGWMVINPMVESTVTKEHTKETNPTIRVALDGETPKFLRWMVKLPNSCVGW